MHWLVRVYGSWSVIAFLAFGVARVTLAADTDRERTALAVEALKKLEGVDLEQNASLKAAVQRVLTAVRGTPDFVELIQKFHLKGEEQGLLEVALTHPTDGIAVDAVRLVLEQNSDLVTQVLRGRETNAAVNLASLLGNMPSKLAWPILRPLLTDTNVLLPARRQTVVALTQSAEGSRSLLALANEQALPEELRLTASLALSQTRWPEIREQAAKTLPPPAGRNAQPLPPLSELLTRKGDPERGKEVFFRADTGCFNCHQVRGAGRDIGPNLSEIGSKLGKDALYEAIFNPSAGISFGYEAWTLELTSGDEAYGLIVSETPEAISVKDTAGIVTRHLKKEIAARRQMKLSLMPVGLQQTMTADELVDLVEYLGSLKKM
jgi:putative heme-binding domain-containing protein